MIFTARDPRLVLDWLNEYKFLVDSHYDQVSIVNLPAVAYIDDRAIHFVGNYEKLLLTLLDFKPYWEDSEED